jgi:hypothetical protein
MKGHGNQKVSELWGWTRYPQHMGGTEQGDNSVEMFKVRLPEEGDFICPRLGSCPNSDYPHKLEYCYGGYILCPIFKKTKF